jgi:hypothetical protein
MGVYLGPSPGHQSSAVVLIHSTITDMSFVMTPHVSVSMWNTTAPTTPIYFLPLTETATLNS